MRHVAVYYGPFEENFHLLKPSMSTYRLKNGRTGQVMPATADGIVFAYMQDPDAAAPPGSRGVFMGVMAGDVPLKVPVPIQDDGVHLGFDSRGKAKWFGPNPTEIQQDEAARRLLLEMAERNPWSKKALLALWDRAVERLGGADERQRGGSAAGIAREDDQAEISRESDRDAAARWAALFPDAGIRRDAARMLSRSILSANALGGTCWTVTFAPSFVRLNVGMPYALTLAPDGCQIIVRSEDGLPGALKSAGLAVQEGQVFGSAPGTLALRFPLGSLAEVHGRAWRSHVAAMEIAAQRQPVTPHVGYSPELIEYLRVLGFEVPHSLCPGAVSVREAAPPASEAASQAAPEIEPFDPKDLPDGRRTVMAAIVRRQGQGPFRDSLLCAYGSTCAITGCDVPEVLEAAHIVPFRGEETNHVQNGLLLRADLHTLFDLRLLELDTEWRVRLDRSLRHTPYWEYEGKAIALPTNEASRPSLDALAHRRDMM